jgi:hypothetical protein
MATGLDALHAIWEFSHNRVKSQIEAVRDNADLADFPTWRPGPGRAHAAWQWMHLAVTEEIFACERFEQAPERAKNREYWDRFRGGSVPGDDPPSLDLILRLLDENHDALRDTLSRLRADELDTRTATVRDRTMTMREWFHILVWHLAHHHGQVHLSLNLFKAQRGLI